MAEKIFYLLMASSGHYISRCEWPVALYEIEKDAQDAADRSMAWARERDAIIDFWRMEILTTWQKIAHPNQYGKPFINPDPPPRPADPEIPPNPDDPENTGDDY
jgi:hypothetical protein